MDVTQIVEILMKHIPAMQAVYLFGSCARGDEHAASDVDLAVLLPPGMEVDPLLWFGDLRVELELAASRTVDLIDLRTVSTVLQKEVVAGGIRVFTGDERAAGEFEMLTFSHYQKLNEERREILEEFGRTGRAVPL